MRKKISPRALVAASFKWDDDFVRVWYLGDDGNVALVTYTCAAGDVSRPELAEAEQIIRRDVPGTKKGPSLIVNR